MATTFSGTNNEIYQISDFEQIVGLRSTKNTKLRLRVLTVNCCSAIIKSVQIYDEGAANCVISSLPYSITEVGATGCSSCLINYDDILRVLNAFGFNVEFSEPIRLSMKTLNFLKTLNSIGYQYMKFTDAGIYFYLTSMDQGQLGNDFIGFHDCDFSPLSVKEIYNIKHLIEKVTTR